LIDTNILIYYMQNNPVVCAYVDAIRDEAAIASIVYYEVLNYRYTSDQERAVRAFLEQFAIIDLTRPVIDQALQNRRRKKIKLADNFILATAQIHDLTLVTNNTKDFASLVGIYNPLAHYVQ